MKQGRILRVGKNSLSNALEVCLPDDASIDGIRERRTCYQKERNGGEEEEMKKECMEEEIERKSFLQHRTVS